MRQRFRREPTIGRWKATRYSLLPGYCGPCGLDLMLIPIGQWAAANYVTVRQVRTLAKRREVLVKRHQGRYYVVENPS